MEAVTRVKNLVGDKSLVVGTDITMKLLRTDKVKSVFMSSNCPAEVEDNIRRYAGEKVEVEKLPMLNDELGVVIKKGFRVSVISVKK